MHWQEEETKKIYSTEKNNFQFVEGNNKSNQISNPIIFNDFSLPDSSPAMKKEEKFHRFLHSNFNRS